MQQDVNQRVSPTRVEGIPLNPIVLLNTALVVFDCDGVLIDSELLASRLMSETLREFGVQMSTEEVHLSFTGNAESASRIFCQEALGIIEIDELFKTWQRRLYKSFEGIEEIDGISNIVTSLTCPICVASNSSLHRLTRSLGRTRLWLAFKGHIFSADHVLRPKPAPDLFLHCAREFDVSPQRCIVVDDSLHGIAAAEDAGMFPIGFVDPNDPRKGRAETLLAAGARCIATGANDLGRCLKMGDKFLSASLC